MNKQNNDTEKRWERSCPKCGKKLLYSSYGGLWNASHKNTKCYSCRSGQSHPHSENWKRELSRRQQNGKSFFYKSKGKCRDDYWEIRICPQCSAEHTRLKSQSRIKFCGFKCAMKYLYGFHGIRISKTEIGFSKILESLNIKYEPQFELDGKYFDFRISGTNILIEVDGIYWHAKYAKNLNEAQMRNTLNDACKTKLAAKHGYVLLRFWEDDITTDIVKTMLETHHVS